MDPIAARHLWWRLEPLHAGVYFAPESKAAFEQAGFKGYWMGYFATRSAPFGEASAELVLATFYNFNEPMVRRAIPDAWRFSTPQRALDVRLELADLTLRRTLRYLDSESVVEASKVAEAIARAARPEGRPLFAANAALPWPSEPHRRLWHAATLLREHRGDGHVALLQTEEIDGCEAHVISAAAGVIDPATQKKYRGWSDAEWNAAAERLRARGLLDEKGAFTKVGGALKDRIEVRTDELALAPYESVGDEPCAHLQKMLDELTATDPVPYPNPMGLARA
jgi:hypothetical protein